MYYLLIASDNESRRCVVSNSLFRFEIPGGLHLKDDPFRQNLPSGANECKRASSVESE
jgi:hypothetical protein